MMQPSIIMSQFSPCRNFCAENVVILFCKIKILFTLIYQKAQFVKPISNVTLYRFSLSKSPFQCCINVCVLTFNEQLCENVTFCCVLLNYVIKAPKEKRQWLVNSHPGAKEVVSLGKKVTKNNMASLFKGDNAIDSIPRVIPKATLTPLGSLRHNNGLGLVRRGFKPIFWYAF